MKYQTQKVAMLYFYGALTLFTYKGSQREELGVVR